MSPTYINSMETYSNFISQFEIFDNPPSKKGFERHHIVPVSEQTEPDNRQVYLTLPQHMWAHVLYDREHDTNTAKTFLTICGKPVEYFDCWEKVLAYSYTLRKKREEGKKKSAEAHRTPEFRQKKSDSMKGKFVGEKNPMYGRTGENHPMYGKLGENNPNYGSHRTEETKQKLSELMKERMTNPKVRQKISDSMKGNKNGCGHVVTEETRNKLSSMKKGLNTWSKGQKWFNDGTKNVRAYSCPEGFVPGILKRA